MATVWYLSSVIYILINTMDEKLVKQWKDLRRYTLENEKREAPIYKAIRVKDIIKDEWYMKAKLKFKKDWSIDWSKSKIGEFKEWEGPFKIIYDHKYQKSFTNKHDALTRIQNMSELFPRLYYDILPM